jgi:hypothetical protein
MFWKMFTNLREMIIQRTLYKCNINKSKLYTVYIQTS